MKPIGYVAASALVALSAATASADCKGRMESIAKNYGDFFSNRNTTFLNNQPVLRNLRNAAIRLQAQGLEDACEHVVAAMEDAIGAYRAEDRKADAGQEAAVEPKKIDETAGGDAAPEDAGQTAAEPGNGRAPVDPADLGARAVSFTNSAVLRDTAEIEGTDVFNFESERLGDAHGLLLRNGQPTHLVVDHGGFWAFGQRRLAIPVGIVRWDPEWKTFLVHLTEDKLKDAPKYDSKDASWTAQSNDEFYARIGG